MTRLASPRNPPGRFRLQRFVLASLSLHALVLGMAYGTNAGKRLPPLGETTLQAEIALDAARPARRIAAAPPVIAAPADHALPIGQPDTGTPAPARTETTATRHDDPAAIQNYLLGVLQSTLTRYLHYPVLARERGWQGTVLVGVAVASDGGLTSARLLHSSGYPLLDDASLTSLRRIHSLPVDTARLGQEPVEVILPIRFQLADNR